MSAFLLPLKQKQAELTKLSYLFQEVGAAFNVLMAVFSVLCTHIVFT